ncbi:MAG TPA: alpha/beta hydrolase [Candidatus Sulfotelmatobacter sp.]|nr:alpha/beta hydrolase [Candidatus Sulfotelmatobacter sp.]
MHKTKLACFLIAAAAFINIAFADSWSDRITVTVRGHGPDVVLIPGMTCSSAVWDATAAHLEGHYRLHLIQVDGFAGTRAQANAQGPVVQPTVDAIDAYIKANNLKSPKIIGHSLGGTMGLMLAVLHPGDVGALMIVDAFPFSGILLGADDVTAAGKIAAKMRDETIKESQESYARGEEKFLGILVKSPDGLNLATKWAVTSDKSVVARATYDNMTTDLRPELQNIKIPVTVLYPWDSKSPYSQAQTDWFYQQNYAALPNKTFARIDNSYHFIMLDQPDAFLAQVDKFVKLP